METAGVTWLSQSSLINSSIVHLSGHRIRPTPSRIKPAAKITVPEINQPVWPPCIPPERDTKIDDEQPQQNFCESGRQLTFESLSILKHPELRALLRFDVIAAFGSQRGVQLTRDQSRGAIAAEVVPAPLNQDENLVFKFD
jgi:hypothetical protein